MPIGQFKAMWQCSDATWWPTLEAMQMALADDQILNQCKLCHLGTQFATDASGASWWPNLQSVQVAPFGVAMTDNANRAIQGNVAMQ